MLTLRKPKVCLGLGSYEKDLKSFRKTRFFFFLENDIRKYKVWSGEMRLDKKKAHKGFRRQLTPLVIKV